MRRKPPDAHTTAKAKAIMAEVPHFSIRRAEGRAHEFCCGLDQPALVTQEDAGRLVNEGLIHMVRLPDLDGWQYVPGGPGQYNHLGEHQAAVSTFNDIHQDPTTRYRFGHYNKPHVPIDDTAVVASWQDKSTTHPRKSRNDHK